MCLDLADAYDRERIASYFIGELVFIDALGNARCGITGVLTRACECAQYRGRWNELPQPGYRGTSEYDEETGEFFIPKGQAPLAITAGDEHEPWPADWHPFNAVHCGECGREIEQDQALDGQPGWTHVFND